MILNDSQEVFKPYTSSCGKCKYFKQIEFTCLAFPDGIPDKILKAENDHRKPLPKQKNNIVFEPMKFKQGSGRELFEYYVSQNNDYSSTLLMAHTLIGENLFPMLEKCERSNQKIVLIESKEKVCDPDLKIKIR